MNEIILNGDILKKLHPITVNRGVLAAIHIEQNKNKLFYVACNGTLLVVIEEILSTGSLDKPLNLVLCNKIKTKGLLFNIKKIEDNVLLLDSPCEKVIAELLSDNCNYPQWQKIIPSDNCKVSDYKFIKPADFKKASGFVDIQKRPIESGGAICWKDGCYTVCVSKLEEHL